jgi:HAD superfamily hydrolase (TIGR01509 family)
MFGVGTRGCVFDVDGTLVLSNAAHAAAWSRAFAEAGFFDVPPMVVRSFIGMGGQQLVSAIKPRLAPQIRQQIVDSHRRIFRADYLHKLKPAPGARELVSALAELGYALAVATSAGNRELSELLAVAGLESILTLRVSADDVCATKPAPDGVLAALKKMQLSPAQAVMVADSPFDVTAAHEAGVRIIALRCGGWNDRSLSHADAIFDDPAQLQVSLDKPYSLVGATARLA